MWRQRVQTQGLFLCIVYLLVDSETLRNVFMKMLKLFSLLLLVVLATPLFSANSGAGQGQPGPKPDGQGQPGPRPDGQGQPGPRPTR